MFIVLRLIVLLHSLGECLLGLRVMICCLVTVVSCLGLGSVVGLAVVSSVFVVFCVGLVMIAVDLLFVGLWVYDFC